LGSLTVDHVCERVDEFSNIWRDDVVLADNELLSFPKFFSVLILPHKNYIKSAALVTTDTHTGTSHGLDLLMIRSRWTPGPGFGACGIGPT
jgi:hypothetical protein